MIGELQWAVWEVVKVLWVGGFLRFAVLVWFDE